MVVCRLDHDGYRLGIDHEGADSINHVGEHIDYGQSMLVRLHRIMMVSETTLQKKKAQIRSIVMASTIIRVKIDHDGEDWINHNGIDHES